MRIPRDVNGKEFAELLEQYGYRVTRQTGSHIRLTTFLKGEHHITIPVHKSLRIGTLNSILTDIARHLEMDKRILIENLFGKM